MIKGEIFIPAHLVLRHPERCQMHPALWSFVAVAKRLVCRTTHAKGPAWNGHHFKADRAPGNGFDKGFKGIDAGRLLMDFLFLFKRREAEFRLLRLFIIMSDIEMTVQAAKFIFLFFN